MRLALICLTAMVLMLSGCSTPSPSSTQPKSDSSQKTLLPEPQTSRAVLKLLERARRAAAQGDMQKAESLLERTVRIEPRNATLWNYLAKLRLEQGRAQEAQGLAAKSTALAGDNQRLVADNWRIIAHARYKDGDVAGAQEAQARARQVLPSNEMD